MNYTIRNMKTEDIPQVQQVAKTSWNATYEGIIPFAIQESFLATAYNDSMMKKRMEQSFLLVAEVEGKVVGFANFSPVKENGEAELGAIYLDPSSQGKGLGTVLLRSGIAQLENAEKILIKVEKDNKIGMNFYQAKGFELVSEFDDDFDGHVLKTVRMALKL
ncbi:GNAT family N-acetyltransferase [Planococcus sp. YIM B11945]|uniref:GNAT family N-acetyltransferase n=1 Tax=Planococcus sp. YIM B11945 TaxID=3435410 RepID=UPI003D7D0DB3